MSGPPLLRPEELEIRRDTKYLNRNPLARRLLEGYFRALADLLDGTECSECLEVGCGEGIPMRVMAPVRRGEVLFGLDVAREELDVARQNNPGGHFLAGSAYALPFPDAAFGLVLCCEVLEHLEAPGDALEEIRRVGRDRFVFSVPDEPLWRLLNMARGSYLTRLGNTPGHIGHWSAASFEKLLSQRFRVERLVRPRPWLMALCRKT